LVDFYWRRIRKIGEFDGRVKYTRGQVLGNRDPAEVVWEEKVREDALRFHSGESRFALADPAPRAQVREPGACWIMRPVLERAPCATPRNTLGSFHRQQFFASLGCG